MDSSYGLGWKNELMRPQPIWTADPSIEHVAELAHRHLKLSPDEAARTTTEFRFQGAFNKLYAIDGPRGSFFMRISLPVDPRFKTLSEVATIGLLHSHTSIPVPQIIARNSSSDNEVKFEWILMEPAYGQRLGDIWSSLPWNAKVSCVKEVVGIMAQLFELRYRSIGYLFNAKDVPVDSESTSQSNAVETNDVVLGRTVSILFFWNTHLKSDVHRGPFASSKDWLDARFQLMEGDCERILESQDADEDDVEDMKAAELLLKRLRMQLSSFFPSNADDREEFALHHQEISLHNLIVDSKGKLQALVDWSCVSVMPLWKACQIPCFIDSPERTERPNSELYTSKTQDTNTEDSDDILYEEHLNDFECTCLRDLFLQEMARLAPQWIMEYQNSKLKVDFDVALESCDGLFGTRMVRTWLDHVEAGEEYRKLQDF